MRRRTFIRTTGLGSAGVAGSSVLGTLNWSFTFRSEQKPNILFITTDYQAGEDIPCSTGSFLQMPNLKRLYREGVVFNHHYCTAPICMPARYTFISGQYPHNHGMWDNGGKWVPEGTPLLMQQLSQRGYQVIGVGKMHFHPWDRMAGFHKRIFAERKGNSRADNNRMDDYARFLSAHGLSRWSYLREQWKSDIFGVYDWPFAEKFHIDHFVGEQTVKTIENLGDHSPWFLWASFNGPHNPWDPPARCSDPYKRMKLPAARLRQGELQEKPMDHTRLRFNYTRAVPDRIDQAPEEEKAEIIHRIRAGHYGGLTFIDEQIGRILHTLERRNLLENTVVIYSADHGCELGDHHNIHKGLFYERSARVPMIIWNPARFSPASVDSYSGHIDLFPTILSLTGTKMSSQLREKLEGHDLVPVIGGSSKQGQQQAYNEIRGGTSIVTDDWKLSIYPADGDGELYDRHSDPEELYNLFNHPDYLAVRKELTDRLIAFHPPLKNKIDRMNQVIFVEKDVYRYRGGEHIPPDQAPCQAGKSIEMEADIIPVNGSWDDGPVMVAHVAGVHGYAIYIKDGYLAMGFRRWGKDIIILSPEKLPVQALRIGARVNREGLLTLLVDGQAVSSAKTDGPVPLQEGHERVLAPHIFIGRSPEWARPVGEYTPGLDFSEYVQEVELKIDHI
ncbi:MAG: sulfatase family protein [Bacteroidales bacterium]